MSQGQRKLAAIMFTDMVGYTALGQKNESLSLALVDEQRKLVRPILGRHNGKEVKTIGDAFLVEFPSALDAVRCAYDIQRGARELNLSLPSESRLHLRIGIHLGDVIVDPQGDISGDAVNVASRIEPLSKDGGVCITRQVYDHVQNKVDIGFTSIGTVPLKNVAAQIEVFMMEMPWDDHMPAKVEADRRRIAVLPFASLSPDPNDEYFADGLTEELITKLSEIEGLRVIARTSVMNYKKREKSVSQIGKELTVGSVIEGSVRKAGNKVRITAQLINTQSEEHQWASTYDRELNDIFEIQSDVATRVAGSLRAGVLSGPEKKETGDVNAYMFYLRATQLIHESTEASLREAVTLLEQAVSEDPGFAKAHAGIAMAMLRLTSGGHEDFTSGVAKAEESARTALKVGPEWAETHSAMGTVHTFLDRFDQSEEEIEKALEINPNLVDAHIQLGINQVTFGRVETATQSFLRGYELDPLRFGSADFFAESLWQSGRSREALEVLGKMREIYPRNPKVYASIAECYISTGEYAEAEEALEVAMKVGPDNAHVHIARGILFALTGRREGALKEIQYLDSTKTLAPSLYGHLFVSAALGDLDEAFRALDRQAEVHSWPYNIGVYPLFKELRNDPRYVRFCEKVGIREKSPGEEKAR